MTDRATDLLDPRTPRVWGRGTGRAVPPVNLGGPGPAREATVTAVSSWVS
jgi:hypothetical protein